MVIERDVYDTDVVFWKGRRRGFGAEVWVEMRRRREDAEEGGGVGKRREKRMKYTGDRSAWFEAAAARQGEGEAHGWCNPVIFLSYGEIISYLISHKISCNCSTVLLARNALHAYLDTSSLVWHVTLDALYGVFLVHFTQSNICFLFFFLWQTILHVIFRISFLFYIPHEHLPCYPPHLSTTLFAFRWDGSPRRWEAAGSQQSLMSIRDELTQVYDVWSKKSAYNTIFPGEGSGASQGTFAFISFHHRVSSCILCAMNMWMVLFCTHLNSYGDQAY